MKNRKSIMVPDILARKGGQKLVMLTAYDCTMASLLDSQADILLVGDTLGCVVQGAYAGLVGVVHALRQV